MPCFGHPPVVMDAATISSPSPPNDFRIQRLADAKNVAQAGKVESLHNFFTSSHQHSEGCGSAIPDVDAETLNGFIPVGRIEPATANQIGGAIEPWRKNAV